MEYTSAQANKLLRQLQEEHNAVITREAQSRKFVAATVEDPEQARPAYDYDETQARLALLERQIRTVKHAINAFNLTHCPEGFNMTVDQMLIYIPQLTSRKQKLSAMTAVLAKRRLPSSGSEIIEYEYANYDLAKAEQALADTSAELNRAQLALDRLNSTETMTITL